MNELFDNSDEWRESWSAEKLGRVLGVTSRRVNQLVREQVLPQPTKAGRHDPELAVPAFLAFIMRRVDGATLKTALIRRTVLDVEKRELDLKIRSGELVEAAAVKRTFYKAGRQVRDQLLAIPNRVSALLAAELEPNKVHDMLSKEISQALHELGNGHPPGKLHG